MARQLELGNCFKPSSRKDNEDIEPDNDDDDDDVETAPSEKRQRIENHQGEH